MGTLQADLLAVAVKVINPTASVLADGTKAKVSYQLKIHEEYFYPERAVKFW